MKKFILGFITALGLVALVYFSYPFIRGFFGGGGPVSPENLNPKIKDYGSLRVEIFGKGNPLGDVEVDVGNIGPKGPESFTTMVTDTKGIALFEKIPIGTYDIFFNGYHFPKGYEIPKERNYITIVKNQLAQKRIDLAPQQ